MMIFIILGISVKHANGITNTIYRSEIYMYVFQFSFTCNFESCFQLQMIEIHNVCNIELKF